MHSIALWPTLFVLAVAIFTDLRNRPVPNWLVFPFLLAGIAVACWLHGWQGLGQSLCGLGLGAVLFGILCWMGGMGMGEVKLCAAIGAWIGPAQLTTALIVAGMAGGVMAIGWALGGGFLGTLFVNTGEIIIQVKGEVKGHGLPTTAELVLENPLAGKMPYVPAIAIGTFVSFFSR